MEKESITEIQKLGLNNYEAKIYLALLERDTLTVSEIAKLSRVPRVRTYDILEKLVGLGLASLKPGKYMRYSAVDFDTIKSKFMDQIDTRFSEEKNNIEKVTLTLKKKFSQALKKRDNYENSPLNYIEIIKDPYLIHKRFMELVDVSKNEVLIFSKPPYTGPKKILDEQTQRQSVPLAKGVIIKSIYEIPVNDEDFEGWYAIIDAATSNGEEARVMAELPMKMAVIDEQMVILPLKDPVLSDNSFTAQVVDHTSLAKGLRILFYTLWNEAIDYKIYKRKDPGKKE